MYQSTIALLFLKPLLGSFCSMYTHGSEPVAQLMCDCAVTDGPELSRYRMNPPPVPPPFVVVDGHCLAFREASISHATPPMAHDGWLVARSLRSFGDSNPLSTSRSTKTPRAHVRQVRRRPQRYNTAEASGRARRCWSGRNFDVHSEPGQCESHPLAPTGIVAFSST